MKNFIHILVVAALPIIAITEGKFNKTYYRSYKCEENKCARTIYPLNEVPFGSDPSLSEIEHSTIAACRLSCDPFGALWPIPTGQIALGRDYVATHPSLFTFDTSFVPEKAKDFVNETSVNFIRNLRRFVNYYEVHPNDTDNYAYVNVVVIVNSSDLTLDWQTDESYSLNLTVTDGADVKFGTAIIVAKSVYGARHAMETLLQLTAPVIKTGGNQGIVILRSAIVTDAPVFAHRGLTLDTSRHFVPVTDILRTIDGLSACKMNVLHWHATDSQSFPLDLKRVPAMALYGAYSPEEIYTTLDMELIVAYGRARGVRVILEIDAPSHSGSGWEWGPEAGLGDLAVCINSQPWRKYCIQPPCGQLNPVNPNLYNVLRNVYKDLIDVWGPSAVFHMGGDEVFLPCWNSTPEITEAMKKRGMNLTANDFLQLWSEFQASLLSIVDIERGSEAGNVSAILWTSELTNPAKIEQYLDRNRYVIHTWVESSSNIPYQLLDLGYRLIISTKNAWYLDHGVWGSTKYHNWRDVYFNLIPNQAGVLGGEVAMWGEYVDGESIDPRIWPRTAAAGERMWSNPSRASVAQAEARLHGQRDRLRVRGIRPEPIAPEWCAQHDGQCQ